MTVTVHPTAGMPAWRIAVIGLVGRPCRRHRRRRRQLPAHVARGGASASGAAYVPADAPVLLRAAARAVRGAGRRAPRAAGTIPADRGRRPRPAALRPDGRAARRDAASAEGAGVSWSERRRPLVRRPRGGRAYRAARRRRWRCRPIRWQFRRSRLPSVLLGVTDSAAAEAAIARSLKTPRPGRASARPSTPVSPFTVPRARRVAPTR